MKIIGHRGARGLAPENTATSLRKALEHHVDMLEFDVRVTKDGVPVLHHDAKLNGPNRLKLSEHSYGELKEHFPGLMTLEEALDQIAGKAVPYIEVKHGELVRPIAGAIKSRLKSGAYSPDGLRIASKSQKTLRELHEKLPDIPVIVIEPWSGVRAHRRAKELGAQEIAMNQLWLWWGFIRGFKNSDKKLYAYTLNNSAKAKRWQKWGLAGVITDYPDRFSSRG
ncbi:MAG TPA: glycerophosphodiester phosphodiesterase [Candidatus Saccharimonadales bacterium]|nr:glycerophosphodiester phosphodiesterase [Candidatus Saccharimonadales bacterium]